MVPPRAFTIVGFLIFLVLKESLSQNALEFPSNSEKSCTKPTYLSKVNLNQTLYAQSIHYGSSVPELTNGFTTHFWLNLDNAKRNATLLSYALDLHQLDTLVLKYIADRAMPLWELTLNGIVVFGQPMHVLTAGQWYHITVTWNASSDTWAFYQDGGLVAEGKSLQGVANPVLGGGGVAIGIYQKTLTTGMDQGQGLEGWITHFYLHSQPIGIDDYIEKVWPSRCLTDMPVFKDIIDWVQSPHKLVGGVAEVRASTSCGQF